MIIKKILTFILVFSFFTPLYADTPIEIAINPLFANRNLNVGILVVDAKDGQVIYEKNADRYFMPASNQKLFTAFAALLYLQKDFHYQTYLFADLSKVHDGVLDDNIYFKFTGDPTLTYNQLDELIGYLAKANINYINGDIIIDDSAFDDEVMSPGTTWDDLQYCFGSPISAIILNHNCISPKLMPDTDIKIAAQNPKENLKLILYSLLANRHISFYKKIQFTTINHPVKLLASVSSAPLPELIKTMLKESDNTIANSLFKTMGSLSAQQSGSWKNGQEAMQLLLGRSLQMEFPKRSFFDGAGGSRYNFVTPRQVVALLQKVQTMPFKDTFMNALPIAGVDGTLKERMVTSPLKGKIYAKTGTMSAATSLSGYVMTENNKTLIFSILINNFADSTKDIEQLEDKLCEILIKI